jgi:hypothetical protein
MNILLSSTLYIDSKKLKMLLKITLKPSTCNRSNECYYHQLRPRYIFKHMGHPSGKFKESDN